MLNEYLYEIISLIVLLTSIVIYFLTRRFHQEAENNLNEIVPKNVKTIPDADSYNQQKQVKVPTTVDEEEVYTLQEEDGSFGHLDHNPFEHPLSAKGNSKKQLKSSRKKIPVPKHGKIRTEDFQDFAGVKLLVAEDNIINQKVISGLLKNSGIEITMADDGQVALDILEKNSNFDLILMDAHMPRVDGFEATRIIRNTPTYEDIVIVALSGDIAVDDIRKMNEAGMQEHLEKPLNMDSFYDILYAYTKDSSHTKVDSYKEVVQTKELTGNKGLAICGGDENFYKDILAEFTLSYSNTSNKLLELLQNKNMLDADALLLDFIGIVGNIGADTIKIIALDLKEAIKDKEEKTYITILDDFDMHLEILLKDIAAYR